MTFSLDMIFLLVLIYLEFSMWSVNVGGVVFLTIKIVFKAQLTHLHTRAFPQSLLPCASMAGLISGQQL